MGIPPGALPDNSVWLTYAYDAAYATVNTQLSTVPGPFYMLAVYNLGGDNLVNWAQDDVQPPYPFPTIPCHASGPEGRRRSCLRQPEPSSLSPSG